MEKITVTKNKNNPYVILSKKPLEDSRLSWKAKGIWAYLLSRPDNWVVRPRDLINRSTDGRDSVYAGLNELEKFGYVVKTEIREKGKFSGYNYIVYEEAQELEAEKPYPEKPYPEKPYPEKPYPENPEYNNKPLTNNDFNNKTTTTPSETAVVVSSATLQETDKEKELVVKAETLGIKKTAAIKHIKQYGLDAVQEKIVLLGKAITDGQKNGKPIVTPGAWLHTALKEGFTDNRAHFEQEQATKRLKNQETAAAIQKAAEEALFAEKEEVSAIDPTSPFAQIAASLGALKVI